MADNIKDLVLEDTENEEFDDIQFDGDDDTLVNELSGSEEEDIDPLKDIDDIEIEEDEIDNIPIDIEESDEDQIDNIEYDEDELNNTEDSNVDSDSSQELEDDSGLADLDIADLNAEIAKLERELSENDREQDEDDSKADSSGAVVNRNTLLDEDETLEIDVDNNNIDDDNFSGLSKDNDFISDTGEIVVMDPSDNGDTFQLKYIDIEKIAVAPRIRKTNNVEDLVKSIKSTGLLRPVDVALTNVDGIYVLLNGYRRILACAKAGKRSIPCIINTKVRVQEIPILEAMYNHQKSYSIKEQIDYIEYLEKKKGIMSASLIEYLLQMNSGDYTKLKDILNDNDDDIVSRLMEGQLTIDAAFRKLEQRRKKESAEEKDLRKATKVYEEDPNSEIDAIADSGETGEEGQELSDEEIKQLGISADELDDVEEEDLGEMIQEGKEIKGFKPHKQDPKYRERLDPVLRKSVLARDNNTCRICKAISGQEYTEVLDVHHIQEVYLGGNDDIDNLLTACTCCHKLIHLYGRGELNIRPLEEMSEQEARKFKKIVKLGNIIRKGMEAKGMNVNKLKKLDNTDSIGRTKPGTDQVAG